MSIVAAKFGLSGEAKSLSWQDEWEDSVECCHCHSRNTELMLTAIEDLDKGKSVEAQRGSWLSERHESEWAYHRNFWFHDAVAVAVYICRDCAEATAFWNQA